MLKITIGIGLVILIALAMLWGFEQFNQKRDRDRFSPTGSFATVSDHKLHHICAGPPSDLTIWLEAGAGGTSLDWSLITPELGQRIRVCAYDRAGLGWSERAAGTRDMKTILTELEQLMLADGSNGRVILVGHSFGGLIAQAFARKHPGKVAGLVLVDSVESSFTEKYVDQSKSQIMTMRVGAILSHFGIPRLLGLAQAPEDTPATIRPALMSQAVRSDSLTTIADEAAMMPENLIYFASLPASRSDIPVTIISRQVANDATSFDLDWQQSQSALLQTYPNAKQVVSNSDNHYIQFADPELVTREILAMIEQVHSP